jgi:multiple sugar transport system permease protein
LVTAFSDVVITNGEFQYSFTGLSNFMQLRPDATLHYSVLVTIIFIAITVPATVILGTALAVLVDRSLILARIARNVLLWPALITPVVVSVIWNLILSPNVGVLNKFLVSLHLPEQGWLSTGAGAVGSIVALDVWHWTPIVFILIYGAITGLDRDLIDAARVDGANEWNVYMNVVFPILWPTVIAAALIRLTMGAKAFDEMYLLTHGGPGNATDLISLYIRQVFFDQLQLGYGAAISVVVVLAVVVALGLLLFGRSLTRLSRGGGSGA